MFESSQDIANEREVIDDCCKRWLCEARKLPSPPYKMDWLLYTAEWFCAFAEVKCRTERYDPYLIGLHKFEDLTRMAKCTRLKALIVVRWPVVGTFWVNVTDGDHDGVQWIEDKRMRENADKEPCIALALTRFKSVGTNPLQNINMAWSR